jgi:hypothetical protein
VVLSDDERSSWQELEAELAQDPRLARLSTRVAAVAAGAGSPTRAVLLHAFGACVGLVVLGVGVLTHNDSMESAGVAVLVGTCVVAGLAFVAIGLIGGRHPRPR